MKSLYQGGLILELLPNYFKPLQSLCFRIFHQHICNNSSNWTLMTPANHFFDNFRFICGFWAETDTTCPKDRQNNKVVQNNICRKLKYLFLNFIMLVVRASSCSQVPPGNTVHEALTRIVLEAEPQIMGSQPESGNQLIRNFQLKAYKLIVFNPKSKI